MQKPILVLIGPSGAGKSTAAQQLATHASPSFYVHKKYTTRPPRPNEAQQNGEDIFVTQKEFVHMQQGNMFLHVVQPFGQPYLYGIKSLPHHDKDISLVLLRSFVVDIFKQYYPNVLIYQLTAPIDTLTKRMNERLQTGQDIASRLASAKQEIKHGKKIADRTFMSHPDVVNEIINTLVLDVTNTYNANNHNE